MSAALPERYPLLDAPELKIRLEQPLHGAEPLHILDCRFELANPAKGRQDFDAGHIPGARYVHIDDDLCCAKTGSNGRHPLPDFFAFVLRTQEWGLEKGGLIVVMDAGNAMVAGRLWWMLRWAGYENVKVLNGGWKAWQATGGPVASTTPQSITPVLAGLVADRCTPPSQAGDGSAERYEGKSNRSGQLLQPGMQTVAVQDVLSNLKTGDFQLIDGRDAERFTGVRDTMDPVAGHIPGARNRCFLDNLNADGTFKSPEQLKKEFEPLLAGRTPAEIVHTCGSGVTACHNLLAMEMAGLTGSRLYPGSWSEYCSDPSRPIERGS